MMRITRLLDIFRIALQALPKAISFYRGSIGMTLTRTARIFAREGVRGVIRRIEILTGSMRVDFGHLNLYLVPEIYPNGFNPKVSIIVPNFNHAIHLRARLDSIYRQTYKNYEVILLDDFSEDDSVAIMKEYAARHAGSTVTSFNAKNSGGVFHQWRKGMALAAGELIWIAESDDECTENFLDELVRFFANPGIMLALAKTEFTEGSSKKTIWTQEEYLADLGNDIWRAPFVKSANELVNLGWAVKNLAPNVSGVIFRKPLELQLLNDPEWLGLRMCGDWAFYLSVIRGGLVGYSNRTTNFYRQHSLNISVKTQASDNYYREHEYVAKKISHLYSVNLEELVAQERMLYSHWCIRKGDQCRKDFLALYSPIRVKSDSLELTRKPNIAIALYALSAGGGETFPINLANELSRRGYAVTVLNFQGVPDVPGIRQMLMPSIPVVELPRIELVGVILKDLGVELVHSHHAWVDVNLATFLTGFLSIRHIITMHGMYEMMETNQIDELLPRLAQGIDAFVYTTEKNLSNFPADFRNRKPFIKIANALPVETIKYSSRSDLGLGDDDFVLCMVARAIPEKGWEEAILAVTLANSLVDRKIHLLLIGSGLEEHRLKSSSQPEFIHFLGFRSNVRGYFAISDLGFLPTRFLGESAPLVLIDCLLAGRPMLAAAVGEIPYMLSSDSGLAGIVFELEDWAIDVPRLARLIAELAVDAQSYRELLGRVPGAALKFDFGVMVDQYEDAYNRVIDADVASAANSVSTPLSV